jgi:hypothetical protein
MMNGMHVMVARAICHAIFDHNKTDKTKIRLYASRLVRKKIK